MFDYRNQNLDNFDFREFHPIESHLCIDFSGSSLRNTNFSGLNLSTFIFRKCDLENADFMHSNLHGASFDKASLVNARLEKCILTDADLSGADLTIANFKKSVMEGVNLDKADCSFADFTSSNLTSANFYAAFCRGALFNKTYLNKANFFDANLTDAEFEFADIKGAQFHNAVGNMRHVKSIFLNGYPVVYTHDKLFIRDQTFNLDDIWHQDLREHIINTATRGRFIEWWNTWKPYLRKLIMNNPAEQPHTYFNVFKGVNL